MISFLSVVSLLLLASHTLRGWSSMAARRKAWMAGAAAGLLLVAAWAAPSGLVLQKCFGLLLMPMGALWITLLLVALWRYHRADLRRAVHWAAAMLAVTLVGNEPLAEVILERLEAPYSDDPYAQAPFDAVLVLGGGAASGAFGHPQFGPSGDRIALGARLYHLGKTTALVTSGSPIPGFSAPVDSVSATREIWSQLGVAADAIVPLEGAQNTKQEAEHAAQLIRQRGWKRVGIVTSAWHMTRALRSFRRHNLDVVPLPADHRGTATWEGLFSVIPTGHGAVKLHTATWELVGIALGR